MSYYQEIIETIQEKIKDKEYLKALMLLNQELEMPYVPKIYLDQFEALKKEVESVVHIEQHHEKDSEAILDGLFKSELLQLQAVNALSKRNLRDYLDLVQSYLKKQPFEEAAVFLIDALIEQNIDIPIEYLKNDLLYIFIPCDLKRPCESEGFLQADQYLQKWIQSENPSFYEMAKQVLVQQVYLALPLTYEKEEAFYLALSVFRHIALLMNDMSFYDMIVEQLQIETNGVFDIH